MTVVGMALDKTKNQNMPSDVCVMYGARYAFGCGAGAGLGCLHPAFFARGFCTEEVCVPLEWVRGTDWGWIGIRLVDRVERLIVLRHDSMIRWVGRP